MFQFINFVFMKINHYLLGDTCLLDNGIELNVQGFNPKVRIIRHELNYIGDLHYITIQYGFHRIDWKTYSYKKSDYPEIKDFQSHIQELAIKEASKLFPKFYSEYLYGSDKGALKADYIQGCFFNGLEYAFYYNGIKVTEKELIQHFGGMD